MYDPANFNPHSKNSSDSTEHDFVINLVSPSWDGSKVAISLSEKGKEIFNVIIVDVKTKYVYPEIITKQNHLQLEE